jgi:hypothetical protein
MLTIASSNFRVAVPGEVTEEFARMWEKVSLNEEVLRRGYAAVWELRKKHITLLSRGKEDVVPVFEEGGFPAWLKDENADMLVLGLPSPKRHPTFRNIHLLTDRSQLEKLAVELMGMYIDRRKKTEEFNKKLEEEYSRELQKRCETILDILPETEISAENEGAFEMELVHQFFSRSPYRLAEIVDSNFDKMQAGRSRR